MKKEFDGQQKISFTSAEDTKQCEVSLHVWTHCSLQYK
jgi:hypothetical protein